MIKMDKTHSFVAISPADGKVKQFHWIGYQEGFDDVPGIDLWNDEDGYTFSASEIIKANASKK